MRKSYWVAISDRCHMSVEAISDTDCNCKMLYIYSDFRSNLYPASDRSI
jgi:hypothetical protein